MKIVAYILEIYLIGLREKKKNSQISFATAF